MITVEEHKRAGELIDKLKTLNADIREMSLPRTLGKDGDDYCATVRLSNTESVGFLIAPNEIRLKLSNERDNVLVELNNLGVETTGDKPTDEDIIVQSHFLTGQIVDALVEEFHSNDSLFSTWATEDTLRTRFTAVILKALGKIND